MAEGFDGCFMEGQNMCELFIGFICVIYCPEGIEVINVTGAF